MRKFALLLLASFGLAVGSAAPAAADSVQFDPTGGGCVSVCYTIDVLDPTVGNALSMDLNGESQVGDSGTLLYQANLGIASQTGVGQVYANGSDGNFFTFTASFEEEITAAVFVEDVTSVLTFGPSSTSDETNGAFYMYAVGAEGDDLSGTGFVGTTSILSGYISNDSIFGVFAADLDPETGIVDLDQAGGVDNYPLIDTITGSGAFRATIVITDWDPAYFPFLTAGTTFVLVTSEQSLPFITANPSACFSIDGATAACTEGATLGSVGAINGFGTNTILQTDASLRISGESGVSEIPEPATLTLLGLGLLGGAAARRRQLKARKQQQ